MPLTRNNLFVRTLMASTLAVAMAPVLVIGTSAPLLAASRSANDENMKLLKLQVVGNKQVPTSAIDQAMTVHVGERVTRAELADNFQAIVSVYRRANVGARFKQKMTIPRPGLVRVEYIVEEQAPPPPQAPAVLRLDKVIFTGNKRVSDQKIRAVIPIKPGDAVNNTNVASTQAAIVALYKKANIGVKVTPSAVYPQPNHVIVTYTIAEQPGG